MSLYIVDIHGELEGDYEIIKKYEEPFINKPCVSEKACEHDKNVVIDKLSAEIENDWQLKKFPCSPFSCGLRQAIKIIDKYKAETEDI